MVKSKRLKAINSILHTSGNSRIKAHSPEWALFFKSYGRVIRSTYHEIESRFGELKDLKRGESIITKKGAKLTKEYTGSSKGNKNFLTLKINVGNSEFFARISPISEVKNHEYAFEQALNFFERNNGVFSGFNVGVIKPHIVIHSKDGKRALTLTDFYHPNEVVLGVDLPKEQKEKIFPTLKYLSNKLAFRGVVDVGFHNLFFDKKRNKILLFDLEYHD